MSASYAIPLVEPWDHTVVLEVRGRKLLEFTPPTETHLQVSQLKFVRSAADLRADRLPEIIAQQTDFVSFFGAIFKLDYNRRRWTMALINTVLNCALSQEMRIKLYCSTPRPNDLGAQVQPVIQTPGHSSYISGHACESFALAMLLATLKAGRPVDLRDLYEVEHRTELLPFRLAQRIADNRTIAGVHFPTDSAAGAVAGITIAQALIAYMAQELPEDSKKTESGKSATWPGSLDGWTVNGTGWDQDFRLATLQDALRTNKLGIQIGLDVKKAKVRVPAAPHHSALRRVWALAKAEWSETYDWGGAGGGPAAVRATE